MDLICVEQKDAIATVVFNRPDMRNAISLAMWQEIARVTEAVGKDPGVRAVVYRGAGVEAATRPRRRRCESAGDDDDARRSQPTKN